MSPTETLHKARRVVSVPEVPDANSSEQGPRRPSLPRVHKSSLEFCNFITGEAQAGYDLFTENDQGHPFVPLCVLKNHWTHKRVSGVLQDLRLYFTIDTILTCYLRTFSLLVYTGQVEHLACFTDHNLNDAKLPLSLFPQEWPSKAKQFRDLFDRISQEQWMFFPQAVNSHELEDVHLDDRVVIPIIPGTRDKRIAHGDAASVQIVTVHDGCSISSEDGFRPPCLRSFALKTYHTEGSRSTYENEIRALRMLSNFPSENIIRYQGSFRQHHTYNIVMERAEGDLADYFKRTAPPQANEVPLFWRSISQVLSGLERVHHLAEGNREVFGMHEDIKPDNILVFAKGVDSAYNFTPKIVDFGLFSRVTRSISSSTTAMGTNTDGNHIYSSPESSYNILHQQRGPTMLTPKADIFAMAAVLSNTCAWVVGGHDLQKHYLETRRQYHQGSTIVKDTSYKGCFHDGQQCIPTVYDIHKKIRRICKDQNDRITPAVLDIIEQHVFDKKEPAERSAARDILSALDTMLRHDPTEFARNEDQVSDLSDTDDEAPIENSLAALGKGMTIKHLASYRSDDKKRGPEKTELNHRTKKLVNVLRASILERDHFFLIDDSRSMLHFVPEIKEALQELFVFTKDLDPNKVELAFASAPSVITKTSRRVNKLLRQVDKKQLHGFQREADMHGFFPRFLEDVIKPRLPRKLYGCDINFKARFRGHKPTSIYILTDGNWGENAEPGGGLKKPLEALIQYMKQHDLNKEQVSFHFVRFGDSDDGRAYLDHLDHFGKSMDGWDIVDVKDFSSAEAHTIIVGPLSPGNDMLGEDRY